MSYRSELGAILYFDAFESLCYMDPLDFQV